MDWNNNDVYYSYADPSSHSSTPRMLAFYDLDTDDITTINPNTPDRFNKKYYELAVDPHDGTDG